MASKNYSAFLIICAPSGCGKQTFRFPQKSLAYMFIFVLTTFRIFADALKVSITPMKYIITRDIIRYIDDLTDSEGRLEKLVVEEVQCSLIEFQTVGFLVMKYLHICTFFRLNVRNTSPDIIALELF